MSTTLHVGKSKTATISGVNAKGQGVPLPLGYSFGWMFSADGGNISSSVSQNTCKITCNGTTVKGDYVAGQPVLLEVNITSPTDVITTVSDHIYLVPADTAVPPVELSGTGIFLQFTWGPEQ